MRVPPMLTKPARWACWTGSLFVLYVAGTVHAPWLTAVWLCWLTVMLQQWRAHRADYRARVAQRGRDIAFWTGQLRNPAAGPQEREAAYEMLAYLGVTRRQLDEAELQALYRQPPTPEVVARRSVLMGRLDPRLVQPQPLRLPSPLPPEVVDQLVRAVTHGQAPPDVLRRTAR